MDSGRSRGAFCTRQKFKISILDSNPVFLCRDQNYQLQSRYYFLLSLRGSTGTYMSHVCAQFRHTRTIAYCTASLLLKHDFVLLQHYTVITDH